MAYEQRRPPPSRIRNVNVKTITTKTNTSRISSRASENRGDFISVRRRHRGRRRADLCRRCSLLRVRGSGGRNAHDPSASGRRKRSSSGLWATVYGLISHTCGHGGSAGASVNRTSLIEAGIENGGGGTSRAHRGTIINARILHCTDLGN